MLMNSPRLFERMRRDGLDAIIATAPENVAYSSGFWAMSQWIGRGPQNYVLTPPPERGEPCVIASTALLDLIVDRVAELDTWVREIRHYGFFAVERDSEAVLDPASKRLEAMLQAPDDGDAVTSLVRAINDRDLPGARIGIDEVGITPAAMDELAEALPTTRFVDASEVFRFVRAVKTPEEIRRLRRAANIAEESIAAALAVAAEGATEAELERAFHIATIRAGAMPMPACIGVGARSAFSNVQPSGRRLKRGDVIRFDVGGRYQHYRPRRLRRAEPGRFQRRAAGGRHGDVHRDPLLRARVRGTAGGRHGRRDARRRRDIDDDRHRAARSLMGGACPVLLESGRAVVVLSCRIFYGGPSHASPENALPRAVPRRARDGRHRDRRGRFFWYLARVRRLPLGRPSRRRGLRPLLG